MSTNPHLLRGAAALAAGSLDAVFSRTRAPFRVRMRDGGSTKREMREETQSTQTFRSLLPVSSFAACPIRLETFTEAASSSAVNPPLRSL